MAHKANTIDQIALRRARRAGFRKARAATHDAVNPRPRNPHGDDPGAYPCPIWRFPNFFSAVEAGRQAEESLFAFFGMNTG